VDVEGKVALITGAASGIGRATCERFARAGALLCAVDIDAATAEAVAGEFGGIAVTCDGGDPQQVEAAFDRCERELGGPDVAFLNAGIAIGVADLTTLDDATYRRIQRINVDGVVYGARAAIPRMERRGGGAIVATSSLAGLIPFPPDPIYDAGKHFVVGLMRSLAPTLAPKGITANTVNPGITDTNIITDDVKRFLRDAGFPVMPAAQIADAVFGLVTTGVTGQCWVCQAGREPVPYEFRDVPGPRGTAPDGTPPPTFAAVQRGVAGFGRSSGSP
jgi:NAD(P)-dependent dehydrogenase (short-subunit alcohol dehydrogenase family)